jgi:hypothetical protein
MLQCLALAEIDRAGARRAVRAVIRVQQAATSLVEWFVACRISRRLEGMARPVRVILLEDPAPQLIA